MDNWFTFFMVIIAYFDIKATLKRIMNSQNKDQKDFSLLEKLKGKEVKIETADDNIDVFDRTKKGILKDFNDKWLILEKTTKDQKEEIYYRISGIKGVIEIKK